MNWTAEPWTSAFAAMRERSSTAEILALYDDGLIARLEIQDGAFLACHDNPELRSELVRQFREHPDKAIADTIGNWLEKLAAT